MQQLLISVENWHQDSACNNYQIYVRTWPVTCNEHRENIVLALSIFGKLEHNELCGVTNLNTNWGFLVIPPINFPEIKVCFRAGVNAITIAEILDYIDNQIIK